MRIRYKLILAFVLVIVSSLLPLSLFMVHRQERDRMAELKRQGEMTSRIISRFALNILLMNGGDPVPSRVDAKEMMGILRALQDYGLVYAETVILSPRKEFNGLKIATYRNDLFFDTLPDKAFLPDQPERGADRDFEGFREIPLVSGGEALFLFQNRASLGGKPPYCIGRVYFSRSTVLKPIIRMKRLLYAAAFLALFLAVTMGFVLSRLISHPLVKLTGAIKRMKMVDQGAAVLPGAGDEIEVLSQTFYHMSGLITQKINELIELNEKLTRLDRLKDDFMAHVSHELRTPLYGVIGLAESLQGGLKDERGEHDLSLIITSGMRLLALVNNILDFSRLRYGDIRLEIGRVYMYSLADIVLSVLRPMITFKSIELVNDIDPTLSVRGDQNRLQQILFNLVGNALKFTEEGRIRVSAQPSPEEEGLWIFCVEDTGVGIPGDSLERIFETFEQAGGAVSKGFGSGTGMGLSITRQLITLHGGSIWAESRPGEGSRFYFTLYDYGEEDEASREVTKPPLREYYEPLLMASESVEITRGDMGEGTATLLVVDDEPINLQVLVNHLEGGGYRVVTAINGEEALKLLNEGLIPDMIILDVMMPGISGYEVCRRIREMYYSYEIPVLMLTARNRPEDISRGFDAGANDYLLKPVDRHELTARVQNLLSLKNSTKLRKRLDVLDNELKIAGEIQTDILPQSPPKMKELGIAVRYQPMHEVGGDFYQFDLLEEKLLAVLLADVTGHGIPAAMVSSMLEVIYYFSRGYAREPEQMLDSINRVMCRYSHGILLTANYLCIDLKRMTLTQSNAGHKAVLVWRKRTGELFVNKSVGRPAGVFTDSVYTAFSIPLEIGDRIIMHTDGITDSISREDTVRADEIFRDLVRQYQDSNAEEFADRVMAVAKELSKDSPDAGLKDDATLIVLDILE